MTSIRFCLATALGVCLLGCEAQAPQNASPQPAAAASTAQSAGSHEPARHEAQHEAAPAHDAADDHHRHDETHPMLRLDDGQPWATDAPLVEGMERIRDAVAEASAQSALDAAAAAALVMSVRDQINFLIANCQLEPEADATLHVFIAQLLGAAAALEADPASPAGLPQLQETLRQYPRYFAHPGWVSPDSD